MATEKHDSDAFTVTTICLIFWEAIVSATHQHLQSLS